MDLTQDLTQDSFSFNSHFISQAGGELIDTSISVTNTRNSGLSFGGGATSEGATLYCTSADSSHHTQILTGSTSHSHDIEILDASSQHKCVPEKLNYCVKVISPHSSDGIQLKRWGREGKFEDLEAIKISLGEDFNDFIQDCDFKFGYIQPGHGSKGRQVALDEPKDIEAMYQAYRGKKQVILWIKVSKQKHDRAIESQTKKH